MKMLMMTLLFALFFLSCSTFEDTSLPKEITIDADPKYFITHGGLEGTDGKVYFLVELLGKEVYLTPDPESHLLVAPFQISPKLDSLRIKKYFQSRNPVKLGKSHVYLIEKLILSVPDSSAVAGI